MNKLIMTIFCFILFCAFSSVSAMVNIRNGNFSITYVDIVVLGGGEPLQLERTYNSKTTRVGWFGYGWGTRFETYVEVAPDGSAVVHEFGGGAETRFVAEGQKIDADAAAQKVVNSLKGKDGSLDEKSSKILIEKLRGDEELRRIYARRSGLKSDIPVGTKLGTSTRGLQDLMRTKEGFVRTYKNDDTQEFFDQSGKLLKIVNKNKYTIELEYNGNVIKTIKDSFAKQLAFECSPNGRVIGISSVGKEKATFTYSGDDLVQSKDTATKPNIYKYTYNAKHLLTQIDYLDKSTLTLAYEPNTSYISSVKDRGGKITNYKYEEKKDSSWLNYSVTVTEKNGKEVASTNKYSYEHKRNVSGTMIPYRIIEDVDGVKTETLYHENCQLPEKITSSGITTNFKYNDICLLTEKSSSTGEYTKLEYNKELNKVSKVDKKSAFSKDPFWTTYSYNDKGDLEKAVSSYGQTVVLYYNYKNQIYQMVESTPVQNSTNGKDSKNVTMNKRMLAFEYNAQGKPVEISLDKVGKIKVNYNNAGEILDVKSNGNDEMAYQVTDAFQNLLSIVEPAAVGLGL